MQQRAAVAGTVVHSFASRMPMTPSVLVVGGGPGGLALAQFSRRHQASRAQLHLMAVVCGIVRNVLSDAVDYVRNQARSAKHSASETARGDHFVQHAVGEIAAASHAIDALIAETSRRLDLSAAAIFAKSPDIDEVVLKTQLADSKGQVLIGKLALRAAEQLFDTGGGSATSRKRNFDRHWRNVRTLLNHNSVRFAGTRDWGLVAERQSGGF